MFSKRKKKLLLIKKPHDFERKHRKCYAIHKFCKTYILEHLIAKASSTKIYFAMNFFFKVTQLVFLYTVYIFSYVVYTYILNYIYYIWYILYIRYICILCMYIYITYIYIYIYITKKTQSQYWVLMGLAPWMNKFESKQIKFNLTTKILLINNYRI